MIVDQSFIFERLIAVVALRKVDRVRVLLGNVLFQRVLISEAFVAEWTLKIINIDIIRNILS